MFMMIFLATGSVLECIYGYPNMPLPPWVSGGLGLAFFSVFFSL